LTLKDFFIKYLNISFFSAILNFVIAGFVTDNAGKPRNTFLLYFWAFLRERFAKRERFRSHLANAATSLHQPGNQEVVK